MAMPLAVTAAASATAAPAFAQTTEISVAPSAAIARVNGDINYSVAGVSAEVVRYLWRDTIGVTGELAYATGSGTLVDTQREIGISITTFMAGVRYRLPSVGRFTPSARAAFGRSLIVFDFRDGPSHDARVNNTYAAVVGGAIDIALTNAVALRIQPDLFYRGACPGGPSGRDGYQVRVSVGGVFAW